MSNLNPYMKDKDEDIHAVLSEDEMVELLVISMGTKRALEYAVTKAQTTHYECEIGRTFWNNVHLCIARIHSKVEG